MQTDGNFVVHNGTTHVWDSGTQGNPGAHLEMQADGNLVIYRTDGSHAWDSGTTFTTDNRARLFAESARYSFRSERWRFASRWRLCQRPSWR
jgi:hypothetical protein